MIKVLSLFSGIGAFEKALENLSVPHEIVNYCEIEPHASKAYSLIHNVDESLNLKDVTTVDTSKLPEIDLITYGFPCVPKGFKVKTLNGFKSIEDVNLNDKVLTHTNTYKPVLKLMSRISDHIYHIKATGCPNLQLTEEHPLYVLRDGKFQWIRVRELNPKTDMLTFNINQNIIRKELTDNELWLIGRYFADGYKDKRGRHRVIFCIGAHKAAEFEERIKGYKVHKHHTDRTSFDYRVADKRLNGIFEEFTTGSCAKSIPNWIIDLPKDQLQCFFDGYYSGDGYTKPNGPKTYQTVSFQMSLGLQEIVAKLYNVIPSVYIRVDDRKETYHDSYCAFFSTKAHQKVIKDKICVRIKNIYRDNVPTEVYNLEVQEDNSYTVNNVIVHNCQDISNAGKQKGFEDEDGSYTRSGLFYEALRIIKGTKPKVAIAENVKALTGKKFKKEFSSVLSNLTNAGYLNYWAVLNAKDYGIPQQRERVFIVSIRNDIDSFDFHFPYSIPLSKSLKNLLETDVDESYYMKGEKIDKFLETIKDKITPACLRYERTEYAKEIRKEYEKGLIDERRCNLRQYNVRDDGCSNTLTTVQKDNLIVEKDSDIRVVGNYYYDDGADAEYKAGGRVYDADGVSPTLSSTDFKHPVKILEKSNDVVIIDDTFGFDDEPKIYRNVVPTLRAHKSGLKTLETTPDPMIVASRGRNPDNPSDRTAGANTEQRFEINNSGVSNTITTVQKDNYVLEPRIMQVGNFEDDRDNFANPQNGRVYSPDGVSPTLNTMQGGNRQPMIVESKTNVLGNYSGHQWGRVFDPNGTSGALTRCDYKSPMLTLVPDKLTYRIRKLTPKECWRLMGFEDADIEKVQKAGISKTHLYMMAGNSIVVQVLEALFASLIKAGVFD